MGSEDETDDQKSHQDREEDERDHDGPSHLQPTPIPTPTDAETIKAVLEGITEQAKAICKRGQQAEFCCVRQCKKIAEENANHLAVHVRAACVKECSQAWRESRKA